MTGHKRVKVVDRSVPLTLALIGTRGVPARYGGFETCVEEVGARLVERGHTVRVYCRDHNRRSGDMAANYRGMELVHQGALQRRSLETLSHTALAVSHLVRHRTDAAIVFNAANAPLLPALRAARIPVATHVDGLEWKRAKWGPSGRRYYRLVERLSVAWSDALIADAEGIADYYRAKFDVNPDLISYGSPDISESASDRLGELGLVAGQYHLVVARFEPENNVDIIVEGFTRSAARLPLVVVGSAPYSDGYIDRVHELADDRTRFLGSVWDQELLDQLYCHARTYLHGHSVGGTNPSLLRAIGAGTATVAYDVVFNREVLADAGTYFRTSDQVSTHIVHAEGDLAAVQDRALKSLARARLYNWDGVAEAYERLAFRLSGRPASAAPISATRKVI